MARPPRVDSASHLAVVGRTPSLSTTHSHLELDERGGGGGGSYPTYEEDDDEARRRSAAPRREQEAAVAHVGRVRTARWCEKVN